MTAPEDGKEAIRESLRTATVLAFPRAPAAAAALEAPSSQMGGSAGAAAAAGNGAGDAGRTPPPSGGASDDFDDDDLAFARLPMTDLGNAERFAGRFRDALRYCPSLGWLAWDGRRWCRDGADERVKGAEHATARAIQREAAALAASDLDMVVVPGTKTKDAVWASDKLRGWGRVSEGAQKLAAMHNRACAMLAIEVEALDRDPMKISVGNGTLHVDRRHEGYVVLRPHDPADYITRLSPVDYDPEAEAPLFDAFLDAVHPPETAAGADGTTVVTRAKQQFLKSWFGYCLTGDTAEQKMVVLYGKGRNGKGVLVNVASWIAGSYADQIPIESFLDSGRARAGGQATPDLAGLPGVRLLSTSEPKKGAALDTAFVKLFTGGDRIKARHLNKDYFAFTPQAKLTIQGNYRPKMSDTDEGIWSRVLLVPCDVFIPKDKRDPKLFDKLQAEGPGILNRLLDGLRGWLDHGLELPESVRRATAQYRADSDPLGRFLETCTVQAIGERVQATVLYDVFCAWARVNGETVWAQKGFGGAMTDKGFATTKSSVLFYLDLRLTKHVVDFPATTDRDGGGLGEGWERVDD